MPDICVNTTANVADVLTELSKPDVVKFHYIDRKIRIFGPHIARWRCHGDNNRLFRIDFENQITSLDVEWIVLGHIKIVL